MRKLAEVRRNMLHKISQNISTFATVEFLTISLPFEPCERFEKKIYINDETNHRHADTHKVHSLFSKLFQSVWISLLLLFASLN